MNSVLEIKAVKFLTDIILKNVLIFTTILEEKPYDEAAWTLKMKALTQEVYVDDLETDEEGIADIIMDENSIAQMARPGTSLKNPNSAKGTSQAYRPVTQSGRPLSGIVRPGTQSGRPGTMEQAIRTRTAFTARPITSSSGRFVRLGTASMLSQPDGPFINFARLNISKKYAALPNVAKHLFEYAYYHDNDIRQALDIAAQATQACHFEDWWWKFQLGKCYYRFGMFRDAEKQFKSSIKQQDMIDTYLWLGKVYIGLDQPLAALDVYKQGLEKFPQETFLMGLNDLDLAVKYYKDVLNYEAIDVEAIACIAAHHFYNDQPEVALRYYRRDYYKWVFVTPQMKLKPGLIEGTKGNLDQAKAFFVAASNLAPHLFEAHFNQRPPC
ncbi:tetratricopeptide repeat protein 8 [Caerostris extrusa]|uniref:Tetratricopeptide repeat protein 8 n=1 Tax=Caerostris extrusa TaxID=172846 RepID=A0AAV4NZG2_CAEEX|nr:tetratricopeptide repeat protein 8 [Caerostris extrusa]